MGILNLIRKIYFNQKTLTKNIFLKFVYVFINAGIGWNFLRSFSSLPLIHSRRVVVSYKRKYVHKLLVNRLFKPAQEKVWLGELTVLQWP